MSQIEHEKIKEKLRKDFPGTYIVFDEEVMCRIKNLRLPEKDENQLLKDLAVLESTTFGSASEWLDEWEDQFSH